MSGIGNPSGGGISEDTARALIASQRPDAFVEVSPTFSASDQFNQYPTLAQGAARATALKTGGADLVGLVGRPGFYDEENVDITDGVVVYGDKGCVLRGPASPSAVPLLNLRQSGSIGALTIQPQAANPTQPMVKVYDDATVVSINHLLAGGLTAPAWGAFLDADEPLSPGNLFISNSSLLGVGTLFGIHTRGALALTGINLLIFMFAGTASIKIENGALVSPTTILRLSQSAISHPIFNTELDLDTNIVATLVSSEVNRANCILGGGKDSLFLTNPESINQDIYPESGENTGTLRLGLDTIKDNIDANRDHIDDLRSDVALLASSVEYSDGINVGDFQTTLVEQFNNKDDIDGVASANFTVEDGFAITGKNNSIDAFEAYADTAALQAVWIASGASISRVLGTTGGVGGSKFMEIAFTSISDSDKVYRDYAPVLDMSVVDKFSLAVLSGGVNGSQYPFRLFFRDVDARLAWSAWIYAGPSWTIEDIDISSMAIPAGFKYYAVDRIGIEAYHTLPGGVKGTWGVDIIAYHNSSIMTGRSVDAMDSLTGWNLTGANISALSLDLTDPREGTGNFKFTTGPVAGSFNLKRTWPGGGTYAAILATDSIIRVWAKAANVITPGGAGAELSLELTDEAGNGLIATAPQPIPFNSSFDVWIAYDWFIDDLVRTGGTPGQFNFAQIVEIEISNNGGMSGQWDLLFDSLEAGDVSRIQSDELDFQDAYNQIKAFFPNDADSDGVKRFRVSLSGWTGGSPFQWTLSEYGTEGGRVKFGLTEAAHGTWLDIEPDAQKVFYRIIATRRIKFSGVALLEREV